MKRIIMILLAALIALTAAEAAEADGFLIVAPNGAPAIAVSGVYADLPESVRVIGAADQIAESFGSGEADFIIAPINLGAKLFKAGKSTYRLAAVVTWGNLVFASRVEGFTPDMIEGRRLVLFGENTQNASIALFLLKQKKLTAGEIDYRISAADTQALLMNDEEAESVVMTAEPAVTAAKIQAKNKGVDIVSWPLNDLYKEVTGYDGFPQAGVFVREKTVQDNPELILLGLEKIRESAELCETDPETVAKTVVEMEIIKAEPVALKGLPGCGIRFVNALEAKEQIEFVAQIDLTQFGGEIPSDDFYYAAE